MILTAGKESRHLGGGCGAGNEAGEGARQSVEVVLLSVLMCGIALPHHPVQLRGRQQATVCSAASN